MASRPRAASLPRQVRIIGGQWKRTPLPVLEAEGLRPTPDRVRETLFNWLAHLFDGAWEQLVCLDMFAGSGALGFEAASRGAGRVVMIDDSLAVVRQLESLKEKLRAQQVQVMRGNALSVMQNLPRGACHLVFLDPPFGKDWLQKALPACVPLLAPGGMVYAEAEEPLDAESWPDWEIVRADKAGMVFYHLLRHRNI